MNELISVKRLTKTYASGFQALKGVNLAVREGEILALLGPNGAGKTTLISIVCGIVNPGEGEVRVGGHDVVRDYRAARSLIGLVPQELSTDAFESVRATVRFSRGLFGKPPDDAYIEQLLRDLSLWDKRDTRILALSGGMKRRVMIAKALSHEPRILFLDEPTAGVDVQLRQSMWELVGRLRARGVTIILTTHYIEEAEQIADRIGIIRGGEILLVEDKHELMRKLGSRTLSIDLIEPLTELPPVLTGFDLERSADGRQLRHRHQGGDGDSSVARLLAALSAAGIGIHDLQTSQTSLEDIFVSLVDDGRPTAGAAAGSAGVAGGRR